MSDFLIIVSGNDELGIGEHSWQCGGKKGFGIYVYWCREFVIVEPKHTHKLCNVAFAGDMTLISIDLEHTKDMLAEVEWQLKLVGFNLSIGNCNASRELGRHASWGIGN